MIRAATVKVTMETTSVFALSSSTAVIQQVYYLFSLQVTDFSEIIAGALRCARVQSVRNAPSHLFDSKALSKRWAREGRRRERNGKGGKPLQGEGEGGGGGVTEGGLGPVRARQCWDFNSPPGTTRAGRHFSLRKDFVRSPFSLA